MTTERDHTATDPDRPDRGTRGRGTTGLGILGGVFDPVHRAHIQVALAALGSLPVDRVSFLPAGLPPHKQSRVTASVEDRLRMLEIALADEPRLDIDDRELRRDGPSYTVLTLRELKDEDPERPLYFIIGADNILHVGSWHRAEEILELCDLVGVPRPGFPDHFTQEHLPWLDADRIEALNRLIIPLPPDASASTGIRESIARGESLSGLVPPGVADYIESRGLYGKNS